MARQFNTPRRRKEWRSIASSQTAFTTDSATVLATLAFSSAPTILRMMGEYIIGCSAAPAATDSARITIAAGIVSTDAATANQLPDPDAEPEYPWLYWASHPMFQRSTNLQELLGVSVVRAVFDVKSMRKVKPRESLAFVAQYVSVSGDPPLTLHRGVTRVLLALP